jgi:hypothetical protein
MHSGRTKLLTNPRGKHWRDHDIRQWTAQNEEIGPLLSILNRGVSQWHKECKILYNGYVQVD